MLLLSLFIRHTDNITIKLDDLIYDHFKTSVKVATIDCLVESRLPFFNYSVNQNDQDYYKSSHDFLLGKPIVSLMTVRDNIIY